MAGRLINQIKMYFEEKQNWRMKMNEPLKARVISDLQYNKSANIDNDKSEKGKNGDGNITKKTMR
ncbi:MAG: hypothetical protein IJ661_03835 [Lachnospiraceae bacterium]|nr:hypothetical protein [Lachnospiraceae bacterium]